MNTIVFELHLPRRVAAESKRSKDDFLTPWFALDIVMDPGDGKTWGFDVSAKRRIYLEIPLED